MGAAKMWLHHALLDVDRSLSKRSTSGQGGLICLDASTSSTEMVVFEFLAKVGAQTLYFNEVRGDVVQYIHVVLCSKVV